MRSSRAARASCGVLLAAVLARTVDAGAVELDTVRAAEGNEDATVWAADVEAEGADEDTVCDDDVPEELMVIGVAI
eukprot:16255805-Heterocapsa_arctica.AAC.1